MKNHDQLVSTALAGLLALGFGASCSNAIAGETEKCFGVAKAGQNGCNSNINKHSCAGRAKVDNDPDDFRPVPAGTCQKIGGKLRPEVKVEMPGGKY